MAGSPDRPGDCDKRLAWCNDTWLIERRQLAEGLARSWQGPSPRNTLGKLCGANTQVLLAGRAPRVLDPESLCGAQVDVDQLDQNAAVNKAGEIIGNFQKATGTKVSGDALQPYDEVCARPGTLIDMPDNQQHACAHLSCLIRVGRG